MVPEDAEQEILSPSFTRNPPVSSQNRYLTHLSLIQPRPAILRQPSLPAIRTSVPLSLPSRQTFDPGMLSRVRAQSIVSPIRPAFALISQPAIASPLSSASEQHTPISAAPAADNANSDLERQKLNALVIASGLADEDELQANESTSNSSPSQVHLEEPNRGVPVEVESPRNDDTEDYTQSVATQAQVTTSDPNASRTSTSRDDFDDFDEDASYYGKEIDPLFSPYSYPPRASKDASPASKWSLSSSVEMDLGNKRSSSSKSLKSKGEKFRSLLSRFSSSQSSGSDKHVLSFAVEGQEEMIRRQRSHSDVPESVAGRSSESSQAPAVAYGSWESVPPTPTTALSTTSISVSTSYSPATPSDNEGDSNDCGSSGRRYSDEKPLAVSPVESSVALTRDTSSSSLSGSGTDTSIANSVVDTMVRPPLKHSISTASLKTHGLKSLVSKIGLSLAEGSHDESFGGGKGTPKEADKRPSPVPRSFRERMMLKNNGSALSLILGKGGNKAAKPKRKLLISGVEHGNYRKYEAISSWCEVSSRCL